MHGYITGRRYTPPDYTAEADRRSSDSVVINEPLEPSEKEKASRALDVADLPKA